METFKTQYEANLKIKKQAHEKLKELEEKILKKMDELNIDEFEYENESGTKKKLYRIKNSRLVKTKTKQ